MSDDKRPDRETEATRRCTNPYCYAGKVRCEGGIAKGVYFVICCMCRGTGKLSEATHA